MELLGCRASVMFPWEKQTSPSTNPASPEPINFVAEPYGQSWGMICPQELSIPLPVHGTHSYPITSSSGAWGDAGMQGIGMGYLGSNEMGHQRKPFMDDPS